jgi:hypothetical protein
MNCRLKFEKPAATDRFGCFDELLDAQQIRALLEVEFGADAPSPQCLQGERRIFCVVSAGVELYPAFQWHEGRLITGLKDVLSILTPHRAAWKILAWFSAGNRHLEGARPADPLPLMPATVSEAARLELQTRPVGSLLESGRIPSRLPPQL